MGTREISFYCYGGIIKSIPKEVWRLIIFFGLVIIEQGTRGLCYVSSYFLVLFLSGSVLRNHRMDRFETFSL